VTQAVYDKKHAEMVEEDIKEAVGYGFGEIFFTAGQVLLVILFALCTKFDEGAAVNTTMPEAEVEQYINNRYAPFQDVHVMIYIGFGFLMTFARTSSLSALAFNWVVSVWAFQWAILSTGFWEQVVENGGGDLHKIPISLDKMIAGDFGAGCAMITFGAILGKCNL